MTATEERPLRYIDSDGHILEPPTGMLEFAPAEYRDRIWHIETDADGAEWSSATATRTRRRARRARPGSPTRRSTRSATGEISYSETRPSGWTADRCACRTWTRTASSCRCCTRRSMLGLQSLHRRRVRPGAGPRVQRLVRRPPAGGRGPAVRRRRAAADAPPRRRAGCRRRDPPRRRAAGDGVGVHAAEPGDRVALLQRPGLRPDLVRAAGHRAARSRSIRSSRPTCPARARA